MAFQGFKSKDSNFNVIVETQFEPDLPKFSVVSQDLSKALLNIINNAFYYVNEKARQNGPGFQPKVIVTTKVVNGYVWISISDNGPGIPEAIKDKIFQPFFTTKPTGQGTGLGLSLAYALVTKGHNGTLKVLSEEGQRSEFIIQLPV